MLLQQQPDIIIISCSSINISNRPNISKNYNKMFFDNIIDDGCDWSNKDFVPITIDNNDDIIHRVPVISCVCVVLGP
jgi:hypothetical protein